MKEEALKLADELDALHQYVPSEAPAMIRRLVEELDKQWYMVNKDGYVKPLSDEEIDGVAKNNFEGVGRLIYMIAGNVKGDDFRQAVRSLARAIEERHGIK